MTATRTPTRHVRGVAALRGQAAASQAARVAGRSAELPAESMTVRDLEQVRALADPLRLRLLEEFGVERTTAQVAQRLGEKPTRLYHHVDALERAGVLRRTRTQRKRGTLEQYYLAVARRFVADARLFASTGGADAAEGWERTLPALLERTATELGELGADPREMLEGKGLFAYLQVHASQSYMDKLRRRLERLLRSLQRSDEEGAGPSASQDADGKADESSVYRLVIAYYPLPPERSAEDTKQARGRKERS